MMNSYKVKSNPLMASSNKEKVILLINDFKIYEGKALMINCQEASERRCCSYD